MTTGNGDLQLIASRLIVLKSQIDSMTNNLEDNKKQIREGVPETPYCVTVPSQGYVQVTSPSLSSKKTKLVFDETKWNELSPELKQALLTSGVVREETQTTPAKKAGVTIKPNA